MFFLMIVAGIPVCALAWWAWAHWRLRAVPRPGWWRLALAAFVLAHVGFFGWLLASRWGYMGAPPRGLVASTYIWMLVLLPLTTMITFGTESLRGLWRGARAMVRRAAPSTESTPPDNDAPDAQSAVSPTLTRRQALASLAVVGAPIVAQGAALTRGLSQLDEFRVREITVPSAHLPAELDGLTIALVSDTHVGRFTRGPVLHRVAQRVCELDCDLVCFPGDLIDFSLADLPEALAMMRDLRARHGVHVCEGNHDLFQDRAEFRRRLRQAELGFLVNESHTLEIRGRRVQLVGLRWGQDPPSRGPIYEQNLEEMAPDLDPDAFQILLSHHPHAFDEAANLGIPLTLAGHTHGGQLNFAEGFGLVQYVFRYMSGLYTQAGPSGEVACVVSNGVGNWFPLRVNAPAEIVKLTLRVEQSLSGNSAVMPGTRKSRSYSRNSSAGSDAR